MLKQTESGRRKVIENRNIRKLNEVLAGVELTKFEEKTLIWIAGYEADSVDNLLSVIEKADRVRADNMHCMKCCSGRNAIQFNEGFNSEKTD